MRQTAPQATWLDVDGMRLHCLTDGESGPSVVLLPGYGLSDRPHTRWLSMLMW
ncbi:MAG: hypothetical protein H0U76_24625 [Ktedonobacteraceae bacterium]|nr:hypothetical protein [Ktedonobacteraceae bacterium]